MSRFAQRQQRSRRRLVSAAREWAKLSAATTAGPFSWTSPVRNARGAEVVVTVTVELTPLP